MKGTEFLNKIAISITPVGSRVTCNPPPTNTDEDYLVLIDVEDDQRFHMANVMHAHGFKYEGDEAYGIDAISTDDLTAITGFKSFRCGDINLIVTSNTVFHERFLAASARAKELNLMLKAERVALFQTVLYGAPYAQRKPY